MEKTLLQDKMQTRDTPSPTPALSGMCFCFLFASLSQFHPSRPGSKLTSTHKLSMTSFTPLLLWSALSLKNTAPPRPQYQLQVQATFAGCTTAVQSAVHMLSLSVLTARQCGKEHYNSDFQILLRTMNFRCGELRPLACSRSHS